MSQVSVRLFGGAAAAFGAQEVEAGPVDDLAGMVEWLSREGAERSGSPDPERLREVLDQCSFFVDGEHYRSLGTSLPDGCRVDVLPPFAGG